MGNIIQTAHTVAADSLLRGIDKHEVVMAPHLVRDVSTVSQGYADCSWQLLWGPSRTKKLVLSYSPSAEGV